MRPTELSFVLSNVQTHDPVAKDWARFCGLFVLTGPAVAEADSMLLVK